MSFWKRTLLGSDEKTDELPNSSAKASDVKASAKNANDAISPVAKPPSAATVGPPPMATAYTNSATPREMAQMTKPKQEAAPPTFHIFQPLPQPDVKEDESNDAVEPTINDKHGFDCSNEDSDKEVVVEGKQQQQRQQEEDEEWDFEETEASLQNEADGSDQEENDCLQRKDERSEYNMLDVEEDSMALIPMDAIENTSPECDEQEDLLTPWHTEEDMALVLSHKEGEGTPLSPKFDFLKESVPLQQLQDSTSKRRHESLTRTHDLDCKLASLQAKLAHESIDRGKTLNMTTLNNCVTKPLEAVLERWGTQLLMPSDGNIHSRLAIFEANRMHHVYVKLPDTVTDELESAHEYVTQELQASLRLEASKSDKRIGGSMVRRFDSIAGTAARRYQEEAASRRASLVQVQSLAQMAADLDEQRAEQFLHSLKELREILNREREGRKARDKEVMDLILERTTELKRALLEAAGTGNA